MAGMREPPTNTWRGVSAEQRREQRRERLLAAGLQVIGALGWSRTTVRAVCAESGLSERYYYEAFADSEALLLAVFESVREQTMAAVTQAAIDSAGETLPVRARACIAAGLSALLDDPRKGKVLFLEATSNEALQQRRHDDTLLTALLLGQIAEQHLGLQARDRADAELSALAIVGAESALVSAYLAGRLDITRNRLIDHITELHLAVAGVSSLPSG
jgi:AcrR family transcriptional regulator